MARIKFAARLGGGVSAVLASALLFPHPVARVSIRWGDPVGESGGGGRADRSGAGRYDRADG